MGSRAAVRFGLVLLVLLALPLAAANAQPMRGRLGPMHGFGGFGMRRPGGFAGRFRQRFDGANVTHDGHLTLDQARTAHMNVIARHFGEIDSGRKGYVTMDDIRNFRQQVLARRRAAQGEGGPDGASGGGLDAPPAGLAGPAPGGGPPPGGPP